MNSPRRPDGPPVRDGKPYSAIAHLADNVVPFVAMANGLRACGFSAPEIHHADLDQGLLIIEDLGDERVVGGDPPAPIEERYETAVDALLALHEQPAARRAAGRAACRVSHSPYDMNAFLIEAELLLDWFLPRLDVTIPDSERGSFRALWRELLQPAHRRAADLGAARFPFAQSAVAAATQRPRPARHPRFPGRGDGTARLRPRLAPAGCARRRPRADRARAARPLRARPAPADGFRSRRIHQATSRWPRSAPARSSASSRGSTCATASRNICGTCPAYGATCSAR